MVSNSDTVKVISGLTHGQNYYFRITAVNDDGPESAFSNQVNSVVKTGVIPVIKPKWADVLICSNLGDSINSYQWFKGNSAIPDATKQYYQTNKLPGAYSVETIDFEGCRNTSNVITDLTKKSLTVYPNPASDVFTLKLNGLTEGKSVVSMINSNGIKVMEFQADNTNNELLREIAVSHLEAGTYVIQVVVNQTDSYSTKILIIK